MKFKGTKFSRFVGKVLSFPIRAFAYPFVLFLALTFTSESDIVLFFALICCNVYEFCSNIIDFIMRELCGWYE